MADNIEYVSMSELMEFEEQLGDAYNAEADANANLPPFPKGAYAVIVRFQESDPDKRWTVKLQKGTNSKYFASSVIAEITDNPINPPELVGRRLFAFISTMVQKGSGTTAAQALIQGLGEGQTLVSMPGTHNAQAMYLNDLLANGGLTAADTDWEANLYDKAADKTILRLRGMRSFPKDALGNPIPVALTNDNVEVPARNYLKRWLTMDQLVEIVSKENSTAEEEAPQEGESEGEGDTNAVEAAPAEPVKTAAAPPVTARPVATATRPAAKQATPTTAAATAKPGARRTVPTR